MVDGTRVWTSANVLSDGDTKDYVSWLQGFYAPITAEVDEFLDSTSSFKVGIYFQAMYINHNTGDTKVSRFSPIDGPGDIEAATIQSVLDVNMFVERVLDYMRDRIETPPVGSNYVFFEGLGALLMFSVFRPFEGLGFVKLPTRINNKKCFINVQNKDNKCFKYAVLAAMNYHLVPKNRERVSSWTQFENTFHLPADIEYPVPLCARTFYKIDQANPSLKLVVYALKNENCSPTHDEFLKNILTVYMTKKDVPADKLHMLLFYKGHYITITSWTRLTSAAKDNNYICPNCFMKCHSILQYKVHTQDCIKSRDPVRLIMPKPYQQVHFTDQKKTKFIPFTAYCDFEAFAQPSNVIKHAVVKQVAASAGICTKFKVPINYPDKVIIHNDGDSDFGARFVTELFTMAKLIGELPEIKNVPTLTTEQLEDYNTTTHCPVCNKEFSHFVQKNIDHCHLTGDYRSALCTGCNLTIGREEAQRKLVVVFHNAKNYDMHLLVPALASSPQIEGTNIKSINDNSEKIKTLSVDFKVDDKKKVTIKIIDSFAFQSDSFGKLLDNLPDEQKYSLKELAAEHQVSFDIFKAKGLFPYDWFDGPDKFNYPTLPPREAFHSRLSRTVCSQEDYDSAQRVWNLLQCKTFRDYHDFYLNIDICGLADICENFRKLSMEMYHLDPWHFISGPSLFWAAARYMTQPRLELPHDQEIYEFFKKGIRGGLSVQTHRYSKANNKYMKDFDPTKPVTFIMYFDKNNLYGKPMKEALPKYGFVPVEITADMLECPWRIHTAVQDARRTIVSGDVTFPEDFGAKVVEGKKTDVGAKPCMLALRGKTFEEAAKFAKWVANIENPPAMDTLLGQFRHYLVGEELGPGESYEVMLEVDVEYPKELHDLHNDYPFMPERYTPKTEDLSNIAACMLQGEHHEHSKLCATLNNKYNYPITRRALVQALQHGLKLLKIHSAVGYVESDWLEPYITLNETKRAAAKNDFEKDHYKGANNCVFGKTMENVMGRYKPTKWSTCDKQLEKAIARPAFAPASVVQFGDNLWSSNEFKTDIKLNQPIAIGFAILDYSKMQMLEFHHDLMKKKYGDRCVLNMTDTDSLVYTITSDDPNFCIYEDLITTPDTFDTHNYSEESPYYNTKFKKVAGYMKDEKGGKLIKEYAGLRSKMYSTKLCTKEDVVDDCPSHMYCTKEAEEEEVLNPDGDVVMHTTDPSTSTLSKGIKKRVKELDITHNDYVRAVKMQKVGNSVRIPAFRSKDHTIYMTDSVKAGLNPFDDKRYILEDGVSTLAWGHHRISS